MKASIKRKRNNRETDKRGKRSEEEQYSKIKKNLFIPLSFFHDAFVTVFYIGNVIGQRINQCIKFIVSLMRYTVISAIDLVPPCVAVDQSMPV